MASSLEKSRVYSELVDPDLRKVLTGAETIIAFSGNLQWPLLFKTYVLFYEVSHIQPPSLKTMVAEFLRRGMIESTKKEWLGIRECHYVSSEGLRAILALGYVYKAESISGKTSHENKRRFEYLQGLVQRTRGLLGNDPLKDAIRDPRKY